MTSGSFISRKQREQLIGQRGKLIWFTGLSGSGKSTLAANLEVMLYDKGLKTYLLDGDVIRRGLNVDLTFSDADREENIRRIGEVAALMLDAGIVVLAAFISPFEAGRDRVRRLVGDDNFIEVFVDASLEVCERRDIKGIYRKARAGELRGVTGIDSPYERPNSPFVTVRTDAMTIDESVQLLYGQLKTVLSVG